MIKLLSTFAIYLIFFCSGYTSKSQNTNQIQNQLVYEKLYLHIDREVYTPGEDVWFKSYLVGGISHKLMPGYKNVYVQLLAEDGFVIDSCLMLSLNGVATNDFKLPETLQEGLYTIRTYTKYLLNFAEESVFHQKIAVARAEDSPNFQPEEPGKSKIDVSFLPEGGNMVLNAANHVAFKAIDEKGRGVAVSGKVMDRNGTEVATFETSYKGMGQFVMMPAEGKMYTVELEDYPEFTYDFPEVSENGLALHYQTKGNELQFVLNRNIKSTGSLDLILKASHKGVELFSEALEMTGFQHSAEIFKGLFPLGISKITITDKFDNVLAERLIFVRNAGEEAVKIESDKKEYGTREKVVLDFTSLLNPDNDSLENSLSLAVVNEDYFDTDGYSQSIESYLLLDSELKGPLESPASYFLNEESISADEKLNLIMMVNGWRRYYWDELEDFANKQLPNWADIGLELNGRVKALFRDQPVVGGLVEVGPFSRNFLYERDTTDEAGKYGIDRIYLKDSALIMINATKKNGGKWLEIIHEPSKIFDTNVAVDEMNKQTPQIQIPQKFYRSNYYQRLAEMEFNLDDESILLDDIDVLGEKSDGHFRIYGMPDNSLKITEEDWTYDNILHYLEGRVGGVTVSGDDISIRGEGNPLFLVDGLETDWAEINYIPMADIDKIEILKGPPGTTAFGSRGANGVISVFTRTGDVAFRNEFVRNVRGRITPRVTGFKQAREFYAPEYPLHKLDELSDQKPDYRPTMYWNPDVLFKEGKATVDFYTSDMTGKFKVILEGISKGGNICYAVKELEVIATE